VQVDTIPFLGHRSDGNTQGSRDQAAHAGCPPVFVERLVAHPQDELERIFRFIGYGGSPCWNHDRGARNVSEDSVRRRQIVPEAVRSRIKIRRTKRLESMQPRRDRLRAVLEQDPDRLGRMRGERLSCENSNDVVSSRSLECVG
jgi:hypothetical protein